MSTEEKNRVYRLQADWHEVERIREGVASRTPDEYERLYLVAWKKLYRQYPHYLYKDDRYRDEVGPARLEDVSAISYERTVYDVRQARADTLQALTEQYKQKLAASTDDSSRPLLATLLKATAQRVADSSVFKELSDYSFTPAFPSFGSQPDRVVDEPERVGGLLGLLSHFLILHQQFLAAETSSNAMYSNERIPLSAEDEADMAAFEARVANGERLNSNDHYSYDSLLQRQMYQENLKYDRESAKLGAFAPWPNPTERLYKCNLPAKIARYEAEKRLMTSNIGQIELAERHLAQQAKDYEEVKNGVFWCQPGHECLFLEAAAQVDEGFRQYLKDDLAKLRIVSQPSFSSPKPADVWASLLQPKVNYSLLDLDKLLTSTGLTEDALSKKPTADFKGAALAGIVEALRERKYLKRSNNAKLAELLAERYGRDVANPNTIGRNYTLLPATAQLPYTRALALLPIP
jgi:hypothetical protein